MSLIIKKNIWLFIFWLSSFSISFCLQELERQELERGVVELSVAMIRELVKEESVENQFVKKLITKKSEEFTQTIVAITKEFVGESKPVSRTDQFIMLLKIPEVRNFLSELVSMTCDDVFTNPELKRLKEEGEKLGVISKKLQKKLQNQEDTLQTDLKFFEKISRLQLSLKEEAVK